MIFQNDANYYEILEIRPDSSAQDIRNAYLRLKASYRKDNPALYSVLDPSETDDMLAKIEEAFQILSDPDGRKEYDDRAGHVENIDRKIFSISSEAPMEESGEDDLFSVPSTDFEGMTARGENATVGRHGFSLPTHTAPAAEENPFFNHLPKSRPEPAMPSPASRNESNFVDHRQTFGRRDTDRGPGAQTATSGDLVLTEIANETEWRGATLRRIRELRRYSLDDIAQITKISKTYLHAIEEEAFGKLPAPVFVRGFLLQFARAMKIPAEPVAVAYMQRFQNRAGG
ncbi:MAG: helix-turn-helix domain-containing protein [Cryobacterium sp.]|nr:helix-turn-helix domain-containing protein [Oligoflexia bacterium]